MYIDCNDEGKRRTVFTEMVHFSLLVKELVKLVPMDESRKVRIRTGMHCGDVVGGLTGYLTPRFCLFGDAMNVTARYHTTTTITIIIITTIEWRLMERLIRCILVKSCR